MKAMVPVKRVVDANVKVRVKPDGTGIDLANVKMAVNPFCEIGIEEAVRLKEADTVEEVIAVAVGASNCQEQLRTCLALGADRAILVETDPDLEPLAIAKLLQAIYDREQPGIVIFGKQSIDGDNSQTGPMFAALTGLPQGTFASNLAIDGENAEVVREVDGGLQTVALKMPIVVTTDLRLNEPALRLAAEHHEGQAQAARHDNPRGAGRGRGAAHRNRQRRAAARTAGRREGGRCCRAGRQAQERSESDRGIGERT